MKYFIYLFLFLNSIQAEEFKQSITKVAFGSCLEQWNPQPFWKPLIETKPDVFIWLGDNIYFDTYVAEEKRFYYNLLTNRKEFKELKKNSKMLYTWDDHDFGINDSGADYEDKESSQKVFLESFEEKKDSPRWKRRGIYDSYYFGSSGKKVQIILLDTRYFRSNLKRSWLKFFGIKKNIPNTEETATILGEEQWNWFEEELKKEADLRIIVSSIQLVNDSHFFEKWGNFPKERERFFNLIQKQKKKNTIVLSGDRHLSELSNYTVENFNLLDFTSSSLNKPFKGIQAEKNPFRIGEAIIEENFGLLQIDWSKKTLLLQIIDSNGKEQLKYSHPFE